ncbi:hypothetical protein ABIB54_003344 [Frigoribacterium sp. UYMn621]
MRKRHPGPSARKGIAAGHRSARCSIWNGIKKSSAVESSLPAQRYHPEVSAATGCRIPFSGHRPSPTFRAIPTFSPASGGVGATLNRSASASCSGDARLKAGPRLRYPARVRSSLGPFDALDTTARAEQGNQLRPCRKPDPDRSSSRAKPAIASRGSWCVRREPPMEVDLNLPHQNQSGTVPIKVVVFLQRNEARRSIKGPRPRVRLVVEGWPDGVDG